MIIKSNESVVNSRTGAVGSAVGGIEDSGTAIFGHFTTTNPNSQMQSGHTQAKSLATSFASSLRRDIGSVRGLGASFAALDRRLGTQSRGQA